MKVRTTVADYQQMFPDEYKKLLIVIDEQKQNLKTELAELVETRGTGDWRALFTISEKLSQMIGMKLDEQEREAFKERAHQRWFAKEFPQFAITKEV